MITQEFKEFCGTTTDRKAFIKKWLESRKIHFLEVPLKGKVHIIPKTGWEDLKRIKKILTAHYDRQKDTPGANDNSASVFHLLETALRIHQMKTKPSDLLIVLTDGEELNPGQDPQTQGAYSLGQFFQKLGCSEAFTLVLDMTGVGDTLVLGNGTEGLLEERIGMTKLPDLKKRLDFNRLHARKMIAGGGFGLHVEIQTPFSDDLGFLLAGIPAVQISLLPRKEALVYSKKTRDDVMSALPESWQTMHTPLDKPYSLSPQAFPLMEKFLDMVIRYPL